jgi:hypothetical protein
MRSPLPDELNQLKPFEVLKASFDGCVHETHSLENTTTGNPQAIVSSAKPLFKIHQLKQLKPPPLEVQTISRFHNPFSQASPNTAQEPDTVATQSH